MTPRQMNLSIQHDAGFERHRKPTRRDAFLAEMDQVVPWAELCAVIAPHYPKAPEPGAGGRRAVGLERMLRIHFLQQWPRHCVRHGPGANGGVENTAWGRRGICLLPL